MKTSPAAAAMANLDILLREDLVGNAARLGTNLQQRLREAFESHPLVGEVRGVGLIAGIELVADKETKRSFDPKMKIAFRIAERCLDYGLIVRALPSGQVIGFSPPLCITADQMEEIVERFGKGLNAVADEVLRHG